jgi:anti-sigma regulatory factor (Ser/Thr protein kinase)
MLLEVSEVSQVAHARRAATQQAAALGLDEQAQGRVALVATELATNILKHAERGEILLGNFADGSGSGLELLAIDNGPGIADVGHALRDGVSSRGTSGTGLGAAQRQADHFAVYSQPGKGTAIMARIAGSASPAAATNGLRLGSVVVPLRAETVSGDAWEFAVAKDGPTLMAVDGSGHGLEANRAAEMARDAFRANLDFNCTRLMERIHAALAPTRGAAVAVARLRAPEKLLYYVGVGNISGAVVTQGVERRMVSHGGVAGHLRPRMHEFTYPYEDKSLVILHSDGLSAKWTLASYPGLVVSHPALIAAVLFRDFRRANDDASIVVMQAA